MRPWKISSYRCRSQALRSTLMKTDLSDETTGWEVRCKYQDAYDPG